MNDLYGLCKELSARLSKSELDGLINVLDTVDSESLKQNNKSTYAMQIESNQETNK